MSNTIEVYQDRDDTFDIVVKKPDGSPLPLQGYSLFLQVKLSPDVDALISKKLGDGLEVKDPNAGLVRLYIAAADLAALGPLAELIAFKWDLLVLDALGKKYANDDLQGDFVVLPSYTRAPSS